VKLPAEHGRGRQQELAGRVIDLIVVAAAASGETTEDFMVNKIVEIDDCGDLTAVDVPIA
jgi:hypothetical protein